MSYNRTFAEEKTSYILPMFCATKSTADFIRHLIFLDEWVIANVPDGRFRVLRMDFGSRQPGKTMGRTSSWRGCVSSCERAHTSGSFR